MNPIGARRVRIATRGSKLALWQANHVADLIRTSRPDTQVELVPMTTQGDRILDRSLAAIGGKGLFIKELEVALAEQRADLAVHSMKDVPGDIPPGLVIGAVLPRGDAEDALLATATVSLETLPSGARVGTSSLRRKAQLLARRPDLSIRELRGNVDTRIRRLENGELDAIVLARAGLERLGWHSRITAVLDTEVCLPAVGQGIIGIECREEDRAIREIIDALNHEPTHIVLEAERAFAHRLGGSCQSPIAGFARLEGRRIELRGLVAEPDGSRIFKDAITGPLEQATALGAELATRLLSTGAAALLRRLCEV